MDDDLRRLERAYAADPDDLSLLKALNRARLRAGLEVIRDRIIHYVLADTHHRLDTNGLFDRRFGQTRVRSACNGVDVWPREWHGSKKVYYTGNREEITCKTCLRAISKPDFKEPPPPTHRIVKLIDRPPYVLCGVPMTVPLTNDWALVGCPVCRERRNQAGAIPRPMNARSRRRERRQKRLQPALK